MSAAVSVWLREARAYPNGVVCTPHYLASAAGAAMLADGGNAIDAAFAANFVLGVVTPYMCGFGGDLLTMVWDGELHAYRGVGRAPAGATAEFVREQSGEAEMPVFGAHPVTVPGAVEAWFTLIEKFATRSFGELAQRALHYAEEGFPVTKRGAWFFENSAILYDHIGLSDFHDAYGDVQRRRLGPPARAGPNDPDPRRGRARRVLPRSDRRGDRRAVAASGRLHDGCRCRRACRRVGRSAPRAVPGRRDPGDAATHPRDGRARGVAHRRRSRPGRRRSGSGASAHRSGEARAGRSPQVSRRSRRDDDRARTPVARRLDHTRGGRKSIPAPLAPRSRTPNPTAARSTCARPTATACS